MQPKNYRKYTYALAHLVSFIALAYFDIKKYTLKQKFTVSQIYVEQIFSADPLLYRNYDFVFSMPMKI